MITASKTQLAVLCQHSFREDVQRVHPAEETSDAARKAAELGNEVHAAIARRLRGEAPDSTKRAKPFFDAWLRWYDARPTVIGSTFWRPEVAYALRPSTGEACELPTVTDRGYPDLGQDWICGTADAVSVAAAYGVHIIDWKTGERPPSSRHNAQLYTLACAAAAVTRARFATVTIVHVRPEKVWADSTMLDRVDMDAWLDVLADTLARVPTAEPSQGAHCSALYCAIRRTCKANNAYSSDLT